ncbi:ANTAR domain-containing protein [Streptomyces sp. GLT-R25]
MAARVSRTEQCPDPAGERSPDESAEEPADETEDETRDETRDETGGGSGDESPEDSAALLATYPVGRLAATVERLRREVRAAQVEADGRALIELAKGILVERLGCGPAQAARQLAELTEQAGVSTLELAVEVINQAARDRLSEVADAFLTAAKSTPPPPRATGRRTHTPPPYGCGRPRAAPWPPPTPRRSPTPCCSTR